VKKLGAKKVLHCSVFDNFDT